jgi:hypothetical protein
MTQVIQYFARGRWMHKGMRGQYSIAALLVLRLQPHLTNNLLNTSDRPLDGRRAFYCDRSLRK